MKLVFATNNPHKLEEVRQLVPSEYIIVSLEDIGCAEEIPETADTIEGNAQLKANFVNQKYNLPCFADDTGLLIDHLNGEPGVYSARYAGPARSSEDNIDLVLKKLTDATSRDAHFKTVIALHINSEMHLFEGVCKGQITKQRKGELGFGYDPIFQPDGYHRTFAEMTIEEKNSIAHRGIAVRKLIDYLTKLTS